MLQTTSMQLWFMPPA